MTVQSDLLAATRSVGWPMAVVVWHHGSIPLGHIAVQELDPGAYNNYGYLVPKGVMLASVAFANPQDRILVRTMVEQAGYHYIEGRSVQAVRATEKAQDGRDK